MTFEEWWEEIGTNFFYENEKDVLDAAWGFAWQAATLAERERCEKELQRESEHSAPCWCIDGSDTEDGISMNCDCCNFIENVRGAIRKGEGV